MGKWEKELNVLILISSMTLIICFLSCDNSLQKTIQYFKKKENNNKKDNNKEKFINPIVNGFHRRCNCFRCLSLNPFHHSQRRFSNMNIPSSVIGCGRRRMPCLGGSQEVIPVAYPRLDISSENIAPINILSRPYDNNVVGALQQVGVLFKVSGESNDVSPLYGVKRYRNSDTWDYFTRIGNQGNRVQMRVITTSRNNNELQTNDEVVLEGDTTIYRVVIYDNNFSRYVPYFK